MIREHDIDCGFHYARHRVALSRRIVDLSHEDQAVMVPASPAWAVRDVLAHVTGLCADLNAQRFPVGDTEAWTAAHVDDRRHVAVADVAAEWAAESATFEDGLRMLGYEMGSHFLGDLLQHEADVAHALGQPGLVADDALVAGIDWYLDVAHRSLVDGGARGLALVIDGERVEIGPVGIVATVELDGFEAFRALGGRRTVDQLVALPWHGDPGDALGLLSPYGFPAVDLIER